MTDVFHADLHAGDRVVVVYDAEERDREIVANLLQLAARPAEIVEADGELLVVSRWPIREDGAPRRIRRWQVERLSEEVVPLKTPPHRLVVYLDQCVLSYIGKWQQGALRGSLVEPVRVFIRVLDDAVLERESAICLETIFHRIETSAILDNDQPKVRRRRAQRLRELIRKYLSIRSRGLDLHSGEDVLRRQVLQRVGLLTGTFVRPPSLLWQTGLSRDPSDSNEATGVEFRGDTFIVAAPWREVAPVRPALHEDLERRRKRGELGTFDEEIERCRTAWRRRALESHHLSSWGAGRSGAEILPPASAITHFLGSDAFFDLPYPYVGTKLAADILSQKRRRFGPGDDTDVKSVSRALPYCDLMVVDSNMCERVRRLKLDSRFGTAVFPASPDGVAEAATWLERRPTAEQHPSTS